MATTKKKVWKIAGCAGHGINTPGKRTPDGEREWTFNNKVILAFEKELLTYEDVEFRRYDDRTGKTDVDLKPRTDAANNWGADYYISFHHNANAGKWGSHTGVETFIYTQPGEKATALGKVLHAASLKAYGLTDRGLKKENLHIVRETDMPAVLIEGGFMDSTIDIKKLRDDKVLETAGKLYAQALAKLIGLVKKPVKATTTTAKPATSTSTSSAATYKTTADLNLRQQAAWGGKALKVIPKGKTVTFVSDNKDGWYKVKYDGTTGYVHKSYLTSTAVVTYKTTEALNLRATAAWNGKALKVIPKGKTVTQVTKGAEWTKVKYDGTTGWVPTSYLKK